MSPSVRCGETEAPHRGGPRPGPPRQVLYRRRDAEWDSAPRDMGTWGPWGPGEGGDRGKSVI